MQPIPDHATSGRRMGRRKSLLDFLRYPPHLDISLPGRRRSSERKDAKEKEVSPILVDSAIEMVTAPFTAGPTQEHTAAPPSNSSTVLTGEAEHSNATTSDNTSRLLTPPNTLESSVPISVASEMSDAGASEPSSAPITGDMPAVPLTSSPRSRRKSMFGLFSKIIRLRSPRSFASRILDSPPALVLDPAAFDELFPCPEYFPFEQEMSWTRAPHVYRPYHKRDSVEEIFHLDLEESRTSSGLMSGTLGTEATATIEDDATDLFDLPHHAPRTTATSRPGLESSALSTNCLPEEVERETFTDPFSSDDEDSEEPYLSAHGSIDADTDSDDSEISLARETTIRAHIKRAMLLSSLEDCRRRHSLAL